MNKAKKVFAIVVALLAGPLLIYVGGREYLDSRQLAREGKATMATVTGHESITGRKGRRSYYLRLQYAIEQDQTTSTRLRVSSSVYQQGVARGEVKLYYLPANPTVCQAGDQIETRYGMLLGGVLFLGGGIFLLLFYKHPMDHKEAAQAIVAQVDTLCETRREYATAEPRLFRHLDLAFYDAGRRQLEALGFTFIADQEDLTFRRTSKLRILLRVFLSRDGAVAAALYHHRPGFALRLLGAKDSKVIDMETQWSDGSFTCTSNAEAAGALNSPPSVDTCFLPAATTVDSVLRAHAQRLAARLKANPAVQPVRLHDLVSLHRMQSELDRLKAEFRRQTGLTAEELQRLAKSGCKEDVEQIFAEASRLQEERRRKAA